MCTLALGFQGGFSPLGCCSVVCDGCIPKTTITEAHIDRTA